MADINVEKLREELYKVSKALFGIGETCVEASKQHISEKEALSKIRVYLNDAGVWSRFMVDQLIEDCMGPDVLVANNLDEPEIEWIKKVLQEQPMQIFDDESIDDCCMAANFNRNAFTVNKDFLDRISKIHHDDINTAVEKIRPYIKKE